MTCPIDGKPPTFPAVLCADCTDKLDRALGDIGSLLEDLDTALTRQAKKRPARGNHARDDSPLPYDVGASKAGGDLKAVLVGWARLVSDERGAGLTCRDDSSSIADWLLHHVTWLSRHDAAADAYSEIVGAVNNIRRTIDIAPDTSYIGPCYAVVEGVECDETLYAIEGRETVQCRTCGTTWDPKARTLETLRHAETVAQDATTLSRSFALRGIALDTERIKKWGQRGHLAQVGTSHRGNKTYIVAHVARLVMLHEAGERLTPWPEEQEVSA